MKNLRVFLYVKIVLHLYLIVLVLSLSGCAAPGLYALGVGAAAGGGGVAMYNASQDDNDQAGIIATTDVPQSMAYNCSVQSCKNAVIDVLVGGGESINLATDSFIRTDKHRINEEVGAFSSLVGDSEIYVTKSINLMTTGSATKVSIKVDFYRKTLYTQESKKEWPEQEATIRKEFFDQLSKSITPQSLANRLHKKPQEDIRFAQKKLHDLGYNPGSVDGLFGKKTLAALIYFQSDQGLEETGKLDKQTIERLESIQ